MQTAQKLHCTHLDCRDLLEHAPIPSPLEPHPTPPPHPRGGKISLPLLVRLHLVFTLNGARVLIPWGNKNLLNAINMFLDKRHRAGGVGTLNEASSCITWIEEHWKRDGEFFNTGMKLTI